ncbi:NAD(P)-binding protein [Pleurostoma richardsiae]|uniref:NAD(P)-binding protein n=1 Tax=Pleurostoma richardsiae TaxID=41990 RepID=A0AA38RZW5_9PEZI|nr:NAD(P)-binding protein [Pleurostoma richardsiae]
MASVAKVVLITGANTGIGWETAKALLQSSQAYHIFLGSRSIENGEAAIEALKKDVPKTASTIELIQIDLTSDDSINKAFEKLNDGLGYLDVLVNNAGAALGVRNADGMSMRDSWNKTYDVNVSGTQIMTHVFTPLLLKSSDPRLLFVTSGLSNVELFSNTYYPGPAPPAGWPKTLDFSTDAYRTSKVALNMMMLIWHWKLKEDGVKVWSISPGFLATSLGGDKAFNEARGGGHPSLGGIFIKKVVEGERDADVGKVVNAAGIQPF